MKGIEIGSTLFRDKLYKGRVFQEFKDFRDYALFAEKASRSLGTEPFPGRNRESWVNIFNQ